jgi:hypothetical protein
MDSETMKTDPYAFDIQLDTSIEDRNFHQRNKKGQIQRPDVLDDICRGLLVQARIDRIVHGTETKDGTPATLVVFGFRFHGINMKRRFREATITIVFQDKEKKEDADPTVICLWPNGDYTLGKPTDIEAEDKTGGEVGGNAGPTSTYGGASAKLTWERKRNWRKTERASLTGSIFLDMNVRNSGPANAVKLSISEDGMAKTGLVTDFRAAVLLRRKNDEDSFTARLKIGASAHFFYNLVKGLRDVSGLSPANDPVTFKPGKENQYIRPPTLARYLEDKLAENVDEDRLNEGKLDALAGVLGSTVLAGDVPDE